MIRVVQVGLGPVGIRLARLVLDAASAGRTRRKAVRIVGAVDPAPGKLGRDLGTLCGRKPLGIRVAKDLRSALGGRRADAALVTTVSTLERIAPQIEMLARGGLDIVSTCEELVFPWRTSPRRAKRIDEICRRRRVTCLSTGVNPGFLMDLLPCVLTGVSQKVEGISVWRIQDASSRRVPFQQKIGAGLTQAEFRRKKASGLFGHVGLPESMDMIAQRMGWKLTRTTERVRAVIAKKRFVTGHVPIRSGMVRGIEQTACAYVGRRQVIRLEFRAAVGEPNARDEVQVRGVPEFRSVIPGGVNGDIATCAIAFNALPWVVAAEPGLKTMLDIPAISHFPA